jgi:single-strand DNA-binding protein
MAGSVNRVSLVGRLGKDPEVKFLQSSTVCNFSVATDESWTDKQGQKQQRTEWHSIVAWGKLAEICGEYLAKGRQVYIEGSLRTEEYEKDGVKRYATKIIAKEVVFLGNNDGQQNRTSDRYARDVPDPDPTNHADGLDMDDDVPF